MARVHVIDSVSKKYPSGWTLCFQWCLYDYENGDTDKVSIYLQKLATDEKFLSEQTEIIANEVSDILSSISKS